MLGALLILPKRQQKENRLQEEVRNGVRDWGGGVGNKNKNRNKNKKNKNKNNNNNNNNKMGWGGDGVS